MIKGRHLRRALPWILTVIVLAGSLWVVVTIRHDAERDCQAKGATAVRTAPNTYVCYGQDGRVVP